MGFFEGLDAEAYDRTYRDVDLVRRMAAYFRPYGRRMAGIVITILIVSAAGAAMPVVVARGVDGMTRSGSPTLMLALAGTLFLLGVVVWGMNWVRRRLTSRAVADVMLTLRRDAFAAAAGHDLSFYDEYSSGRIVSRITSDTTDFANVVVLITDLASEVIEAGVLLVILARIEWRLIPWLLAMMPFVFLVALGFRRIARPGDAQRFSRHGQRQRVNQGGRERHRRG